MFQTHWIVRSSSVLLFSAIYSFCAADDSFTRNSDSVKRARQDAVVRYAIVGVKLAIAEYEDALSLAIKRDDKSETSRLAKAKERLSQTSRELAEAAEGKPIFSNVTDNEIRYAQAQLDILRVELELDGGGRRPRIRSAGELRRIRLKMKHAMLKVDVLKMHRLPPNMRGGLE